MHLFILVFIFVSTASIVKAEKFDPYLQSIERNLPIETTFMQRVLKEHKTKLALPSLLERWGVINQEAAATYNSILNTVVLKAEYTTNELTENGLSQRRIKTIEELEQAEPYIWSVRASTIFHELSHAEYSWLPRSQDAIDKSLLKFLNTEFDMYLKTHHSHLSVLDRKIARSELFAYFRGDFISLLVQTLDEILLENGYYKTSRTCKNTNFVLAEIAKNPQADTAKFLIFGSRRSFAEVSLPVIFVKGKDIEIDLKNPVAIKLRKILWDQMIHHFAPAKSKLEMINWINTRPEFLKLIEPCRSRLGY